MGRHVRPNMEKARYIGDGHKLTYSEWKELGIKLDDSWEHYSTHVYFMYMNNKFSPNANELLFRKRQKSNSSVRIPSALFRKQNNNSLHVITSGTSV